MPSLYLHLDSGLFFCFGCGVTGDVVEWASRSEGVGWREAIDILDTGRPLTNAWASVAASPRQRSVGMLDADGPRRPEGPDLTRTPPSRIFEALEAAWDYYTFNPLHHRGTAYLWGRGIDVRVLEARTGRREVGHTPARSDGLVVALHARGFTSDELIDAGLAIRRRGSSVADFYRQRVLIPIRHEGGHVCGFVGRNVGDDRWPKYKNPPRTAVYDKSVDLYRPLPPPTNRDGRVIVVEGTLDALAIAAAAIRTDMADRICPVTQSGKQLSANQLSAVLGLHPNPPIIAFDGDSAGRESDLRVARAAAERGETVTFASLPDGHDPASWLAERGDDGLVQLSADSDPTDLRAAIGSRAGPFAASRPGPRSPRRGPVGRSGQAYSHERAFVHEPPGISLF
jgi:DNA primase